MAVLIAVSAPFVTSGGTALLFLSALCGVHIMLVAHDLATHRLPNAYVTAAWLLSVALVLSHPASIAMALATTIMWSVVVSLALMQWSLMSHGAIGMGDAKLFGSLCMAPILEQALTLWCVLLVAALIVHAAVQIKRGAETLPLAPALILSFWGALAVNAVYTAT